MGWFNFGKDKKELDNKIGGIVNNPNISKSEKMRELYQLGIEISLISELLGVRYNFVYNVVKAYNQMSNVKVKEEKIEEALEDDVSFKVLYLFMKGNTRFEITQQLKMDYSTVTAILQNHEDTIHKGLNV